MKSINSSNGFCKMYRDIYHDYNLTPEDVVLISYLLNVYQTLWEKEVIDGKCYYRVSTNFIRNEVPVLSEKDVPKSFSHLIENGYLEEWRPKNNPKGLRYIRLTDGFQECLLDGSPERSQDGLPNGLPNRSPERLPNWETNKNIILKEQETKRKGDIEPEAQPIPKQMKHKYGECNNVLLTDDELQKLKNEFVDWQDRINRLSLYMGSTGKSYKSHYLTILNWARKDKRTPLFGGTQSAKDLAVFGKKDFTPVPVKNIDYI